MTTATDSPYTSARFLGDVVGNTTQGSYEGALQQRIQSGVDVGVGGRVRELSARTALRALRVSGCEYRPDLTVLDGAWIGRCPLCRLPDAVRIWELGSHGSDDGERPVASAFCRRGCSPGVLLEALVVDCDALAAREELRVLRERCGRVADSLRRAAA